MRLADLAERRVAVWGHGREGRAALAALHARLPALRPTVFCSEAEARSMIGSFRRPGLIGAAAVESRGDDGRKADGVESRWFEIVTAQPTAADLSAFNWM